MTLRKHITPGTGMVMFGQTKHFSLVPEINIHVSVVWF